MKKIIYSFVFFSKSSNLFLLLLFLYLFVPQYIKAQVCNPNGNLIIFTNYDGGQLNINVDVNIPNLKIGICTYEPVAVTISGAFSGNVTQVLYAGFNSTQNNNNCGLGNFPTSISGVPAANANIITIPPVTVNNPNGFNGGIICAYSCDITTNQGGCNTIDQIQSYFTAQLGGTLYSLNAQYCCWLNSNIYNVSSLSGACCLSATPSATISYATSPYCSSTSTPQNVSITGTQGGTFSASPAGLTINAQTGAITPSTSTAGVYTVTYSMGGCPSVSTTASVQIINSASSISVTNNSPVCSGDTLILQANVPANATVSWQGPANFTANTANVSIPNFTLGNVGAYFLTVNVNGCNFSTTVPTALGTCIADNDQDGIPDNVDLDDDNDGIPDLVECGINSTSGQQFTMLNGSFEDPVISATTALSIINDNTVPGWETTAQDSLMEFWAFNFQSVPAFQGNQHVELNANFVSTLFQDVSTVPGDSLNWYFAHRGRWGTDVIELKIGTPTSLVSQGTFSTPNTAWAVYNGTYVVPAGQTTTRFAYVSVSASGGNPTVGNFLDGAAFFPVSCHVDSDGDGIPNSWDLDSDNDGIYDVVEAGHGQADANNDGIIDGLPAAFGANGLFNTIETNDLYYANVTYTIKNTDNLADYDFLDLDSDQDGCFDLGEIPFSDPNQDGIAGGTPVVVAANGTVVGCPYPTPNITTAPIYNFQNPAIITCCTNTIPTNVTGNICNGQTYTLPDGTLVATTGNYSTTLTSVAGCDSVVNTNLVVNPLYNVSQNAAVCQGQNYTLPDGSTVNAAGTYPVTLTAITGCDSVVSTNLTLNPIYNIPQNASICQGQNYMLLNGNIVNTAGVYPVTLTSILGCDSVISTTLTLNPTYLQQINASICQGQNYLLPDGSNANTSGVYIFHYQSINTCDSSIQITLTVNQNYAQTLNTSICQGQTYTLPDNTTVNAAGTYTTTLSTVNNCDSVITTQLTVYPTFVSTTNVSVCQGETYTLPNGTTVIAAGSYPVTFQTIHGCDSVIITNLSINPTYTVTINAAICEGQTYTLPDGSTASTVGTYPTFFQTINGCDSIVNVLLFVNPTYAKVIDVDICEGINYVLPDGTIATTTGVYAQNLPTINGCDSLITVNLNVHDAPSINLGNDTSICVGKSVTFTLENLDYFDQYLWSNGNKQKSLTAENVGAYWITAKDKYGCIVSDTVRILSLYPLPANFLPADTVVCDSPNMQLNITGFARYRWENGDTTATRLLTTAGEYSLTVTSLQGCKGSDELNIKHKCEMQVYCPSAFTPNNSGQNDVYFVRGMNVATFRMVICDRWGREMITLNSIDDVWDGTYKGQAAPEGVYMYKFRALSVDDRVLESGGTITLIR